ncbi:hypothetical protein [Croceiramulus getboli]|nr:hypothetical protein P8624_10210 [Flavobacteriaceae bacterium YJPT1-3]
MRKIITVANDQKDALYVLVKSLSKSEKRQFKLYAGRLDGNTDAKFLLLFNVLDKAKEYNEDDILKKGFVTKQQLSNLKAHLYKQILVSLKLIPALQNIRLQIREQLDFATVLYQKGLYKQSLKILEKAKALAIENEEKNVAFEIVELEKVIETQYITRSIDSRAEALAAEAKMLSELNLLTSQLSNLSLQLYGILLKTGYVRSDEEKQEITNFFETQLPDPGSLELGFREKLWYSQAYLWYSFIIQDFLSCYKHANRWVELFEEYPQMRYRNPVFFLKGNNYLMESLYYLKHHTRFKEVLTAFETQLNEPGFISNDNIRALAFLYRYNNVLNLRFLIGDFEEPEVLSKQIEKELKKLDHQIDAHHVMLFYYKLACLHFCDGQHKQCIAYLSKIINNKSLKMRQDLMCFARILNLVAHYEAGMDYHLESLLKSTYKFLIKMDDLHEVQKEMIKFLRNLGSIFPADLKDAFVQLRNRLEQYEEDPYERRSFLYLDILSWLDSRIQNKPVGEVIWEKALQLNR